MLPADHRPVKCLAAALLLLLALASLQPRAAHADDLPSLSGVARSTLEIRSKAGRHWLKIYVAQGSAQQEQGLMFVRALPSDEGMLFPLQTPRVMTMWMKNTLIPLDMLFIDAQGRVVCLREKAVPESLDLITCDTPVKAVLEIGGGQVALRGIAIGDTVVHPSLTR
jgi:hypothetical protein